MIIQCTLMTCHKGVDLHAETALRVMSRDIPGGERLRGLSRAEFHCFWRDSDQEPPETVERLLDIGRFYNPNKHHYGHFELPTATTPWFVSKVPAEGADPDPDWPGEVIGTDWPEAEESLFDHLASGGKIVDGKTFDILVFPREGTGPLISGVFWRLVFDPGAEPDMDLVSRLTVARGSDSGFLINPHMHSWLVSCRD